ncbi:MAG: polymorphic toxin type 8 domain-containing protein [Rickettsiaceae bacterium]|nr:polymorphic toxin type 8 domain-containing protein [Rickettsiaceae bacterium]
MNFIKISFFFSSVTNPSDSFRSRKEHASAYRSVSDSQTLEMKKRDKNSHTDNDIFSHLNGVNRAKKSPLRIRSHGRISALIDFVEIVNTVKIRGVSTENREKNLVFKDHPHTKEGRRNKQNRLLELMCDDKISSADRGWLKQDYNAILRNQRRYLRVPPGKQLAHKRGFEAAKGYDYFHSILQDAKLHRLQHKFDDFGTKNQDRGKSLLLMKPCKENEDSK